MKKLLLLCAALVFVCGTAKAEDEIVTDVKYTTVYEADGTMLKVTKTPDKPVDLVYSYDINSVKEEISRCEGAISLWESKKANLEAIVTEYDKVKPVIEEPVVIE